MMQIISVGIPPPLTPPRRGGGLMRASRRSRRRNRNPFHSFFGTTIDHDPI